MFPSVNFLIILSFIKIKSNGARFTNQNHINMELNALQTQPRKARKFANGEICFVQILLVFNSIECENYRLKQHFIIIT